MLFRRVLEHVRTQNWTAIGIDFVIVVVGVFLGIQLGNWNGERSDRQQEREYLQRLRADFAESATDQQRDLDFLGQQIADQAVVVKSLDACEIAPEDKTAFGRGIWTLGYINPPRVNARTVEEMIAAGNTDLIQNKRIKEQLETVMSDIEWRATAFDGTQRILEHHRFRAEDHVRYDSSRSTQDRFLGSISAVDPDIAAMCAEPGIAKSITAITEQTRDRRDAYRPLLEQYRALLPLIDAELAERWGDAIPQPAGSER